MTQRSNVSSGKKINDVVEAASMANEVLSHQITLKSALPQEPEPNSVADNSPFKMTFQGSKSNIYKPS